ncbi:MAG: S-adenosylmethionine:tRNA ribosyltransferase-isomerase, partial [Acidobacteriota bacterium]
MLCSDFDYALPEELIAQQPLDQRDQSRMLVLDRVRGIWADEVFTSLPDLLTARDVVVLNNTRVFPARLLGHRLRAGERGAGVEALLLRRVNPETNDWEVLAKPGRVLKPGVELEFGNGTLRGTVIAELEEGRRLIRFDTEQNFDAVVDRIGNTPLPPYIKRDQRRTQGISQAGESRKIEEARYQTVFASERGAIAAPTAGLHFTENVIRGLRSRGTEVVEITHHVGYATFQPIRVQNIEDHQIPEESYDISNKVAAILNQARDRGGRVIAVGTTTVRALESAALRSGT